jgi:multicomponent Na+:H+ antiporter subunit F
VAELFYAVAIFLLLNGGVGFLRVLRGPTPADRMLIAQLFGTTGVAVALLLSQASATSSLVDVGLVLGLLSSVAMVAFVLRAWPADSPRSDEPPAGSPEDGERGGA